METNTMTTENGTSITICTAVDHPGYRAVTREQRHAVKDGAAGHAMVDLTINLSDDGATFYVRWSSNGGKGWGKAYRKSGFATEAAAREFADAKWITCLGWIAKVVPVASNWQADFTCH